MSQEEHKEFLDLINSHRAVLYKVVNLYIDDREEREDLIQEILLQALKGFPRFRGESKFSTWLYRVSLNTVFSYSRKNENRKKAESEVEVIDLEMPKSDEAAELYFHIRQMDDVNKMVITLYLEGFGNKEIAEITGMAANTVGVRLHRIKESLTQKMNHLS
ncbi:MAG: sigma-70 family RNA polymerase sigma factor [Bacteroidia bacterium]